MSDEGYSAFALTGEATLDHQSLAGICWHGDSGMHTISGYIAEPARGVLHVHRGHGCLGSWHSYELISDKRKPVQVAVAEV